MVNASGNKKNPTVGGGPNRAVKVTMGENAKGAKVAFPLDLVSNEHDTADHVVL